MRKIITLIAISFTLTASAQLPDSSTKQVSLMRMPYLITASKVEFSHFQISEFGEPAFAISSDGKIRIYGDTVAAVKRMMAFIQEQTDLKNAAEEILRYITVNGEVIDQKAYAEAVKKYLSLKN